MSEEQRAKQTLTSFKVYTGISKQETVQEIMDTGNFFKTKEEAAKSYVEYQDCMPDYVIEISVTGVFKPNIEYTQI